MLLKRQLQHAEWLIKNIQSTKYLFRKTAQGSVLVKLEEQLNVSLYVHQTKFGAHVDTKLNFTTILYLEVLAHVKGADAFLVCSK